MPFYTYHHELSFHYPSFLAHHPFRALYIGDAIKGFATGLFAVFTPIYLFTIFQAQQFVNPVALVFVFYALYHFLFFLGVFYAIRFLPRFGFRKFTAVSFAALILYFVFLILAEQQLWFLLAALLALVIRSSLFWPGYHILFGRLSKREHRMKAVGNQIALAKLVGVFSPLIGGLIIAQFGFTWVLVTAVVLIALAAIPYSVADLHVGHRGGFRPILREVRRRGGEGALAAFLASGVLFILASVTWPLFVFLLGLDIKQLGFITTVAAVLTVLALYLFGKVADRYNRRRVMGAVAKVYAVAWVFRVFVQGVWSALSANAMSGLAGSIFGMPLGAQIYDRMQRESPNEQVHLIVFYEMTLNLGRTIMAALAALYLFAGGELRWIMLFAIPAVFLVPLVTRWKMQPQSQKAQ